MSFSLLWLLIDFLLSDPLPCSVRTAHRARTFQNLQSETSQGKTDKFTYTQARKAPIHMLLHISLKHPPAAFMVAWPKRSVWPSGLRVLSRLSTFCSASDQGYPPGCPGLKDLTMYYIHLVLMLSDHRLCSWASCSWSYVGHHMTITCMSTNVLNFKPSQYLCGKECWRKSLFLEDVIESWPNVSVVCIRGHIYCLFYRK